ncbi:SRP40 [Sanghuangporus vaninii]
MAKDVLEPGVKEIFKALSEVASNEGRLDAVKDVKKALQEWIEMSDFLDGQDAPLGNIIERWKRIQRSTSSVLCHSIAAYFSPEDSVTIGSALNSEKGLRSTSGSSSSSSDESNSSERSESDSDTESDTSSLKKSKAISSSKSSSSNSNSDSDSGSTSSPFVSKSGSEHRMPPAKKRKTEGNQSHVGTVQESLMTRKLDEEKADEKPAVNGGFDATKALGTQPLSPSTHPKSNRRGKEARKSNAPFQRIKTELVTFTDERLRDNSFHSRGAKRGDYGERAHADLIVTRGGGFRKEKNKKKRGSYRGGEITLESHSIKFT